MCRLIDRHMVEPGDLWVKRMDKRYRDRASFPCFAERVLCAEMAVSSCSALVIHELR